LSGFGIRGVIPGQGLKICGPWKGFDDLARIATSACPPVTNMARCKIALHTRQPAQLRRQSAETGFIQRPQSTPLPWQPMYLSPASRGNR